MIKLLIFDVDGTLTSGAITYDSNGVELKSFDVKDGMAIASWTKSFNMNAAIITGRKSEVVKKRSAELGIQHLHQGIHNKYEIIESILHDLGITWKNVACIGDDLNDYKMLKNCKISFCPADAVEDIKNISNVVCKSNGGSGAAREMIEYILKYNNMDDLKSLWV